MSSITRFIPKNHVSYLMGKLVHINFPRWFWKPIIILFSKAYNINLNEAEYPIEQYKSLGDFFVRNLKNGLRPIGDSLVLHPADSVITQAEYLNQGRLIQAKGKTYQLSDFSGDANSPHLFKNGFFVTYYLCPTDYHQVHSPVDGVIKKITHIPGALWPVNQWSTENIEELFSINERVVVDIEVTVGEEKKSVLCVFVGATNVGFIEIFSCPEIKGNQLKVFKPKTMQMNTPVKKGDKLGQFRMGSTVVMVYPEGLSDQSLNLQQWHNRSVKVNSNFI